LLEAKSIAYPVPDAGHASGLHFAGVIDRLGIAQQVNAKAKFMEGTGAEFAAGDSAEIIVSQRMEIIAMPGYKLVGWLPEEPRCGGHQGDRHLAGLTEDHKPLAAKAQSVTWPVRHRHAWNRG